MDNTKTGMLIYEARKMHGFTQKQLAEYLFISDKTVSKWETGMGCPDVSLLPELSKILGIDICGLLSGELDINDSVGGNMKKLKFYVCPECGNLITSTADAAVSCCGKTLGAMNANKAEDEKLSVEITDNEYYISSNHEMTKEHYITFVALLTGDTIILKKQYPEWNLQTNLPRIFHGMLLWHCSKHGLFYQIV